MCTFGNREDPDEMLHYAEMLHNAAFHYGVCFVLFYLILYIPVNNFSVISVQESKG